MKVALCLSGHLRSYEHTWRALKKFIIDPLSADVFIHTWNTIGISPAIDLHTTAQQTTYLTPKINSFLSPKRLSIEPYHMRGEKYRKFLVDDRCPNGVANMFYKILMAHRLCEEYARELNIEYDVVIRARPDLLFQSGIEPKYLEQAKNNSNELFLPTCGHYGGLNDQFAFGHPYAMKQYTSCYLFMDEILQHVPLIPEQVMKQHLVEKLKINFVEIPYLLYRVNNTYLNNKLESPEIPDLNNNRQT